MARPSFLRFGALALVAALSAGCMTHRHTVGLGPTGLGESSARQFYLFFGLLRFNEVDPRRLAGDLTSYEIESSWSFVDFLLMPVLLPLTFTSRTVTVKT